MSLIADEQLHTNTYIWSQEKDQVTISFLVPEHCKSKDLDIVIEQQQVKAGLKGQEPVLKGKLYAPIDHFTSLWQLEKNNATPSSNPSSLTASPSLSIASSFAFLSPAHSPNSSVILPAPALTESMTFDTSSQHAIDPSSLPPSLPSSAENSQPNSPISSTTPPPAFAQESSKKYRLLTLHLEKEDQNTEWVVPVSGGYQGNEMDMDPTSAYHLAGWFETRMRDAERAFKHYEMAAEKGHTRAMLKIAAMYEVGKESMEESPVMTPVYPSRDATKAFEWHKRAADGTVAADGTTIGPSDAEACYIIGTTYAAGSEEAGVEKDYDLALMYFQKCMLTTAGHIDFDFSHADDPNDPGLQRKPLRSYQPHTRDERYFCSAAFQAGLIFLGGAGDQDHASHHVNEPNPGLAIEYWKQSAMLGHAQSCFNIGVMYANGMGVTQDVWEAGRWFGRAKKLDGIGNLEVPPGVEVVEWHADRSSDHPNKQANDSAPVGASSSSSAAKRRKKKTKKRSRQQRQQDQDTLKLIVGVGSLVAVVSVITYFVLRKKD
ncbi:hypothetical protein INT43_004664 [Umbelopsis isabellina]|uniref:CS domain-containing protein n=1 Tax=Mortierella isabellina TaxID=91625 RepID=A0A8H7PGJ1_MORIS|nr:hypothetical protein INT43_004664 [Umbelopsis isabellina]